MKASLHLSLMMCLALAVASIATAPMAQERFPSKPINMIVPSAPGGGTDTTFRMLASIAEADLGQNIVILNRPGASGGIAATALSHASPDGYTVAGVWGDILTVVPHTLKVSYTPANFVPISQSAAVPLVFCVKSSFPARDGASFLAALRAKPDEYTYGTDGTGGAVHLAAERIFAQSKVKARMIPFTDSATILRSFMGDHIHVYGGVIGVIQPHLQSGDARCVMISSKEKSASAPLATSMSELKMDGASTVVWRGVVGVKGTPEDRLKVLEAAFMKAARTDKFKEFMVKQGAVPIGGTAAELGSIIQQDFEAFGKLVKDLGLEAK